MAKSRRYVRRDRDTNVAPHVFPRSPSLALVLSWAAFLAIGACWTDAGMVATIADGAAGSGGVAGDGPAAGGDADAASAGGTGGTLAVPDAQAEDVRFDAADAGATSPDTSAPPADTAPPATDGGTGDAGGVLAITTHAGMHSCATLEGGAVRCWGQGVRGELGNGLGSSSSTPVDVLGVRAPIAVAAGEAHTCAALPDDRVVCWGANYDAALGVIAAPTAAATRAPVAIAGLRGVTALSAGYAFTCALVAGGAVACWGSNDWGQLGAPTSTTCHPNACSPTPVTVAGLSGATALAAGSAHACAIVAGGAVKCWGANYNRQLGNGKVGTSTGSVITGETTPVDVVGLTGATALAAAVNHTCALLADGTVACWGGFLGNELGTEKGGVSATPVLVPGISGATSLAAGGGHTCVVLGGGSVSCWGWNDHGELGNGTAVTSRAPVAVTGLTGATAVAAGAWHTCALLANASVVCWGENNSGVLGDGAPIGPITSPRRSLTPVKVAGL
jgi:alpha-tubulin suppressor-like RCC1 family protein